MIRRAVFTSITLLCSSTSTAGGVMSLEEAEAREGRLEAPHEFRSADGRIRARVPAKVDEVRDTAEGLVVSFDIGSDARLACRITAGDPDLGDAMRRSFEVAIQKVQGLRGHVQMLAPEAPDAGAMGAIPYLSMRWQYGTSDGSEFLAVHGFKQLAFAKLGHLVSCWHLDTGYVKTFDTVTRALAESLQAPFAEPAPYFVEIKTTTAVGSRVGVFMSTLQREASGGIRARQVTALMIPGSGEMHSHFADHLVLLRADGSLLSAGHSILRDGAPALKVELRQRDGLWTVDGQREGSPLQATLAAGSKPATWVEQAQALRRILAAENPVGMESVQTMWIAAKPAELVETRTRVVARNSADEFAALLLLPRYESKIVLDRATGLASRAEVPRGSTTVLVERVYVSGSP